MIKVCCDLYMKDGRCNFGDVISLFILDKLSGEETVAVSLEDVYESDIVAAGSILEYIPEDYEGIIWGAGFMYDSTFEGLGPGNKIFKLRKVFKKAKVRAVRGRLSLDRVVSQGHVVVGDPAILCEVLVEERSQTHSMGIIPHYVDKDSDKVKRLLDKYDSSILIDVMDDPITVVNQIASCVGVISSSLHGIIVAESLGVPAEWEQFSNKVAGNGFKFRDYYTTNTNLAERKKGLLEVLPERYKDAILDTNAVH